MPELCEDPRDGSSFSNREDEGGKVVGKRKIRNIGWMDIRGNSEERRRTDVPCYFEVQFSKYCVVLLVTRRVWSYSQWILMRVHSFAAVRVLHSSALNETIAFLNLHEDMLQ
jgi:hypothetical protein